MVNFNLYEDTIFLYFCLKHFKLQINQNEKVLLIIAISISVACNKTAEVKVKLLT
jgi:hypothetical protein